MKKVTGNRVQVTVRRILQALFVLFLFLYPTPVKPGQAPLIPYILYPAHAASPCPTPPFPSGVPIGNCFGFGDIQSLGEGTTRLVEPAFQLTAAVVVIYFLLGAFKYLRAGGNKEELEGARQMIVHAIIGFILLMFAFLILQFLLSRLFEIQFTIIG